MYLQIIIPSLLFLFCINVNAENYSQLLGSDWSRATMFIEQNRNRFTDIFNTLDADPVECEAVIFPELLRFSRLQNSIEQAALRMLYVKGGTQVANFSIGVFQMKPSFAEEVETAWMKSTMRHKYKLYFDMMDTQEARSRRMDRLENDEWQCVYLAMFVALLLEREPELTDMEAQERVRLLATAYNVSFTASLDELNEWQYRKTFHLDLLPSAETSYFSYSDIAANWYCYRVKCCD